MEVAAIGAIAAVATSAFYSAKTTSAQRKQIKSQQAYQERAFALERDQTQDVLAEQRRKNLNLLNQQLSGYKAKLGAAGLSSAKGSGGEILRNVKKEHDMEDKYLQTQADYSLAGLENSIGQASSRNLLALSQLNNQARQNQIGSVNSAFGITARSMLK